MILHLYIMRRFAQSIATVAVILMAVLMLVELIEKTRSLRKYDVDFGRRLEVTLLDLPRALDEILPLIIILATLGLFLTLARSSELVVTRAAGRSALRTLVAPIVLTLVLGIFATTTLGPIVVKTSKYRSSLLESYRSNEVSAFIVSEEGLWLRQAGENGQTVIRAARSNADGSVFYDVTFVSYAREGGPVRRIEAASAALQDGAWSLQDAKIWPLGTGINPEANAVSHKTFDLPSSLTLERIRETLGSPSGVSFWDMPGFIAQLEKAGLSTRRHTVWLQVELARPVFLMGMVLVAAAFTIRHTRSGGTGKAVLAAILLGFGFYFIQRFAQILGEDGQIPAYLAAWAPPVALIFLALGLLLHAEDG